MLKKIGTFFKKKRTFAEIIALLLVAIILAVMVVYCISLIFPIAWLIINSFRGTQEYYLESSLSLPKTWHYENYKEIFNILEYTIDTPNGRISYGFGGMLYYSFAYALGTAIYATVTLTLTAYAVGRYKFWLTKAVYATGLFVMFMVFVSDGGTGLMLKKSLGIYDNLTLWILTSGGCIFTGTYFFIMTEFYGKLGKEYAEAAALDGAGQFGIFIYIMVPLSLSMMSVIFTLSFISAWNNYSVFMLYLPSYANLALGMMYFQEMGPILGYSTPQVLTGFVVLAIPLVVLYCFSQKYIVKNLNIGGLKG